MTDRHYAQIKNQPSAVPSGSIDLGTTTNRYGNLYLSGAMILGNVSATEASLNVPKISSISFPNSATAGSPTGGETVTITGSGFLAGASVYVANILVSVSTVVSSTTITFTSPVKSDGNYSLSVVNTDGGSASFIPGITYSDFPAFSTAAGSLGTSWEGNAVSSSVAATSDSSVSFSVTSGSLPSGLSLSNTGNITGTLANVMSGNTTYNFTVTASDQEQQKTSRNFSYTVTGDTLTFGSPANNTSYNFNTNMAISNISLAATSELGRSITYTANVLPAGLTLTGNTISGSPSVTANSSSLITASTLTKSANIQLNFSVTPLTVTVNYLLVAGGGAGARDENFGGGGGGAGGVINGSMAVTVGSGVTTVTIGAGGTGSLSGSGFTAAQGANTTLTGGMVVTAYGGGRGGGSNGGYWWDTHNGQGGGSGGGAASSGYGSVTQGKGVYPGSTYVSATRQGYDGAIGNPGGGGGGGAGSVGYANAYGGSGTNTFSSILSIVSAGSGGYIAGGGAGGVNSGTPQAPGGSGGGGAGGRDLYNLPSNGSTNTGSGGGGGRGYDACAGGNGGSGIAILYFPTGTSVSVTGSPATYTSGGNTYYKFTSSGTITF
jgi:hypothetical protein